MDPILAKRLYMDPDGLFRGSMISMLKETGLTTMMVKLLVAKTTVKN